MFRSSLLQSALIEIALLSIRLLTATTKKALHGVFLFTYSSTCQAHHINM